MELLAFLRGGAPPRANPESPNLKVVESNAGPVLRLDIRDHDDKVLLVTYVGSPGALANHLRNDGWYELSEHMAARAGRHKTVYISATAFDNDADPAVRRAVASALIRLHEEGLRRGCHHAYVHAFSDALDLDVVQDFWTEAGYAPWGWDRNSTPYHRTSFRART